MKNRIGMLAAAVGLVLLLGGCKSDCRVTCEKEQECLTAKLDVDACTKTCSRAAADNKDYADKVTECADCVSARVCSEAIKSCFDDCFGVVGFNR